jgi:tRNA-dihydrouridine synthase B
LLLTKLGEKLKRVYRELVVLQIGSYKLDNNLIVAPMAGVTDRPFRSMCMQLGAGMAVSEMISSNPKVWQTQKSKNRMIHGDEAGIRSVQIAGADPQLMAQAAIHNQSNGAQIIDINMGCPAKKVNKKLAGSALLQHPELVREIVRAVVDAVKVPVSLKIRTGWDPQNRNGVAIARIAEEEGIQCLAVHGRTKSCMYKGNAEYDTIKKIKQAVSIPVIANGDIDSPQKAQRVLEYTNADAIMIGRAAQGQPWIFRQIDHYFKTGEMLAAPHIDEVKQIMLTHISNVHQFYGEFTGVRIARKHITWYLQKHDSLGPFRRQFNAHEDASAQLDALECYFFQLAKL